jgi:hypothetical protein
MTIAAMPEFIDNRDGNTLLAALHAVIRDAPVMTAAGLGNNALAMAEICIATAFMSPAGFSAIANRLEQAGHVRLLIGAEPEPEARRPHRRPGDPPQATFERREVAEGLKLLEAGLRRERDRQPFTAEAKRHLRRMAAMLRAGRLVNEHRSGTPSQNSRKRLKQPEKTPDVRGPDRRRPGPHGPMILNALSET